MNKATRREFLRRTVLAATACATGLVARAAANERVRVAVTGVRWTQYVNDHRGRGSEHLAALSAMKDVEIAALCDIDESVVGEAAKFVEEKTGKKPAYYQDFRKLLEDKSIDAVTIATPNQWHSLQ